MLRSVSGSVTAESNLLHHNITAYKKRLRESDMLQRYKVQAISAGYQQAVLQYK